MSLENPRQLNLFDSPKTAEEISIYDNLFARFSERTIEDFKRFHNQNPDIYSKFRRLAYTMKASGRKKYSVDAIIHIIRWNRDITTNGKPFKIPNSIRALYGRMLAYNEPEFLTFFNFILHKRGVS